MALAFIIFGLVLGISGVQGTQVQLYTNLKNDFFGPTPNFLTWSLAIIAIGAIGYVPKLKPVSIGLLVLVGFVVFLQNKSGFFTNFNAAIGGTSSASSASASTITPTQGAAQLQQDFLNAVAGLGLAPATVSNVG